MDIMVVISETFVSRKLSSVAHSGWENDKMDGVCGPCMHWAMDRVNPSPCLVLTAL